MFQRLQKKWKVNGLQLVLILCTFAIGGSLTGYAGRKLMNLIAIDKGLAMDNRLYNSSYTSLAGCRFIGQFSFGQFRFFIGYLKKMGRRMGIGESGVRSQESGVGKK